MSRYALVLLALVALAAPAAAAPLTADEAVRIALQRSTQVIQADASVLDARSGLWSGAAGVLPRLTGNASRSAEFVDGPGGVGTLNVLSRSTSYDVSGTWGLLSPSSWTTFAAARNEMKAVRLDRRSVRQQVVFATRQQFYEVVRAMHLARVSAQSLRLARDNERRVRAMYEVGSVSKSDLLQARVNTSQSQVDSLTADHNVTVQRILLSEQMGVAERELAEVDSTLSPAAPDVDYSQALADARTARPDVAAAEAALRGAQGRMRSAQLARLPGVSLSGSYSPTSNFDSRTYADATPAATLDASSSLTKKDWTGRIAFTLPIFDAAGVEGRAASAHAAVLRARATRDALVRNLESEVRQALLGYQEAREREVLAQSTVESATENLNLVQQKYNVGSATILDLITSQLNLQRAQSELVSALAGIREAEARLDQVRGRGL